MQLLLKRTQQQNLLKPPPRGTRSQFLASLVGSLTAAAAAFFAGWTIKQEGKSARRRELMTILENVCKLETDIDKASFESKEAKAFNTKKYVVYMKMIAHLTLKKEIKKDVLSLSMDTLRMQ